MPNIEIIMEITIRFGVFAAIVTAIRSLWPKTINRIFRPKLIFKFEISHFNFCGENGEERNLYIPFFSLHNNAKKSIKINARLMFNNFQYYGCKGDIQDLYKKNMVVKCAPLVEFMYEDYVNNYVAISEGHYDIIIVPGWTKIFPFCGDITNIITSKKNSQHFSKEGSLLFCSKNTMTLTLNYNGRNYEYSLDGLDRTTAYEKYLNYLSGYYKAKHGS